MDDEKAFSHYSLLSGGSVSHVNGVRRVSGCCGCTAVAILHGALFDMRSRSIDTYSIESKYYRLQVRAIDILFSFR